MTTDPSSSIGTGERPPPVFGSLGTELSRPLARLTTIVSVVAAIIAIAIAAIWLSDVVVGMAPGVGYVTAIWAFAVGASVLVVITMAVMAIVPPLLLRGQDRIAMVVHSWVGAREVRRALGRAARIASIVGSPEETARWLERTPATDALRPLRFEAYLLLGRVDDASAEVDLLTRRTRWEEYRYAEAHAIIEEQRGIPLDEPTLRQAIARIPAGEERIEAEASLAVNLARRALPAGDWRRPLIDVRPRIPGSDAAILVRDFGLTTFEILLRRVGVPVILLIVALAIVLSLAPAFS